MPNALRTATPMGDWRSFRATAGFGGVIGIKDGEATGDSFMYLVEDTVGCALESADAGAPFVLIYHAEKIMVPKSDEEFDVGQRVWWDSSTRLVTDEGATGCYLIGIATEPAGTSDAYVEIDLDGAAALEFTELA